MNGTSLGSTDFNPVNGGNLAIDVGRAQTKDLIERYCSQINGWVIVLIALSGFMWLAEGAFRRYIESKVESKEIKDFIFRTYKFLGIGLLFMAAFSIWWV